MMGLTRQQANTLAFIRHCIDDSGISPSYDEIANAVGVSSKGRVAEILAALVERGHITVMRNRPRSIRLIENPDLERKTDSELLNLIHAARGILRRRNGPDGRGQVAPHNAVGWGAG